MPVILVPAGITEWASLYAGVAGHLPQVPAFEIDDYVRRASRSFFLRSYCWRSRGETLLTTVADQADYSYSLPSGRELNAVHVARMDTIELDCLLPGEEDDYHAEETSTTPAIMVAEDRASFRLAPPPADSDVEVVGTVSWVPASNALGIPTWAFDDYRDHIAAEAAAMLCIQDGRPWTNPAKYAGLHAMFIEGVSVASNKAGPVRRRPLRTKAW